MGKRLFSALSLVLVLASCAKDSHQSRKASPNGDASRGRQVYLAQCITCHHIDPTKDGPLGPAIKGSSRSLLEAKLLHGSYPPGYGPKRPTSLMPRQPHLEPAIPDLAAYLQ